MKLLDCFDTCAKEFSINKGIKNGYHYNERPVYENYMEEHVWQSELEIMKARYEVAYREFGGDHGKELNDLLGPPNMASFGSSSYMIYSLGKDIPGFHFEKGLSTTFRGGPSQLDGILIGKDDAFFVEAKKHEIYLDHTISRSAYDCVYERLKNNGIIGSYEEHFIASEKEIYFFDLKQLICHFLAIGNISIMNDELVKDKRIHFVYLIYNPVELSKVDSYKEELYEHYNSICGNDGEIQAIDMRKLFATILDYLIDKDSHRKKHNYSKGINKDSILNRFHFHLVDQFSFSNVININEKD